MGFLALGLSDGSVTIASGGGEAGSPHLTSVFGQSRVQAVLIISLGGLFLAIFSGLTVIRDIELRVGEVFLATRLTVREYLWGKFWGGVAVFVFIWTLYLCVSMGFNHVLQSGKDHIGFFSLANFYYRNRQEYVDQLNLVQMRGSTDLTPFVAFSLRGLVEELEAVHEEVLVAVREIAFRDYARETLSMHHRLGTSAGDRQLRLLTLMGKSPVSLKELRSGRHPLSHLYRGVSSRTLARDVHWLREKQLVEVDGDEMRARTDLMTDFTA